MSVVDRIQTAQESDMLTAIRVNLPSLSKSHQRVGRMILENPTLAMQSNIEELAERAEVAMPTIVRFARAVGCDGLKDFKLKLAGTLALGADYLHRAVMPSDSDDEVLDNVVGSTISAISEWRRTIDPSAFSNAAAVLNQASRIDCMGVGQTSHFLAQDLQARLFRMGLHTSIYTDVYLQLVAASTLSPGDAAVAISFVGRSSELLETVAMVHKRGAKMIAITCSGTPLALSADIVLAVDVPADVTMPVGTDAYIAQMLVIEVLSILVGRARGPKCIDRLEQIHRLMQEKVRNHDQTSVVYWGWQSPSVAS